MKACAFCLSVIILVIAAVTNTYYVKSIAAHVKFAHEVNGYKCVKFNVSDVQRTVIGPTEDPWSENPAQRAIVTFQHLLRISYNASGVCAGNITKATCDYNTSDCNSINFSKTTASLSVAGWSETTYRTCVQIVNEIIHVTYDYSTVGFDVHYLRSQLKLGLYNMTDPSRLVIIPQLGNPVINQLSVYGDGGNLLQLCDAINNGGKIHMTGGEICLAVFAIGSDFIIVVIVLIIVVRNAMILFKSIRIKAKVEQLKIDIEAKPFFQESQLVIKSFDCEAAMNVEEDRL